MRAAARAIDSGMVESTARMHQAVDSRDARFDGVFFVAIVTTHIYCRPICPSRRAVASHRRFFETRQAAEAAGYRPCRRCRPELAPGSAPADSVKRLARTVAERIHAGALNGGLVAGLAADLGVTERHVRRVLKRELGITPLELAQHDRLVLAKGLLADSSLSVTRIAFASGFQSLRRFNAVFRERFRMTPTSLRRTLQG